MLQAAGQWPYWAQFWRDWDWTTIARTIDNLASVGVNCLQVTATGLADNGVAHPDVPTMRGRDRAACRYAAGKRMVLNPQLGYQPGHSFAGGAAVATAAGVAMAGLFAEQPNIGFIDAMNEVNYYAAPGWSGPNGQCLSDMGAFVAGVRAVAGAIPVSVSVGCSVAADITGALDAGDGAVVGLSQSAHVLLRERFGGAFGGRLRGVAGSALVSRALRGGGDGDAERGRRFGADGWLNGNGAVAGGADCLGVDPVGATDTSAAPGGGRT